MLGAVSRGNAFTSFLALPVLLFVVLLTNSIVENATELVDNVTETFVEIGEFLNITGNETHEENESGFMEVEEYLNSTDGGQIQEVNVVNITMEAFQEDYFVEKRGDYFITVSSEGQRTYVAKDAFEKLENNETLILLIEDEGEYSVIETDKRELGKLIRDGADRIYVDSPVKTVPVEEFLIDENLKVCILDTGVGEEDANGHGTQVASYIKGEIISVKVLDENGIGYSSDVIEGIEKCIDENADVILMYFGYGRFDSYCDDEAVVNAAEKAVGNGIVVVSPGEDSAPGCGSLVVSPGEYSSAGTENQTAENESAVGNVTSVDGNQTVNVINEAPHAKGKIISLQKAVGGISGSTVDAEIELVSRETGLVSRADKNSKNAEIVPGKYDIKIKPQNHGITEITVLDYEISGDVGGLVEIDEPTNRELGTNFTKVYAINPREDGMRLHVKAIASSDALYKCADYSFEERVCNGEWKMIMKLVPGEEYEFYMDSADPGFGEGSTYFTLTDIVIDGDLNDWDAVVSNPHNYISDGIGGIDDLDDPQTADRDGVQFAFTWNDTSLFFYTKRITEGTNQLTMLVYIDRGNDGYMDYGDKVMELRTTASGTLYNSYLHDYVPAVPTGDIILGDGCDMNGSVTNQTTLQTNVPGIGPYKIEFESALNWSTLGLTAGSPLRIHVSLSRGINLPSQVEDNFNYIDTRIIEFDLEPDRLGYIGAGGNITYNHTLTNVGNVNDTYELNTSGTLPFWTVELFYGNGSYIMDTDTDGFNDTGIVPPGGNVTIFLKVTAPANATDGTEDETAIDAESSVNPSIVDSVLDTTHVGAIIIYPDYNIEVGAGTEIVLNHTVSNNQIFSDVIDITNISTQNYNISYYFANGTPLTDTDGDTFIDVGNLTAGSSAEIIMKVFVPKNATIGSSFDITIYANSTADPSKYDYAIDSITIAQRLEIEPSYSSSAGIDSFIFYGHYVHNNDNITNTFDINLTSALGWNMTAYNSDMYTLLNDTSGNGKIDTGPIGPYGETKLIYVKVRVPPTAEINQTDNGTVTATSVLNSSVNDYITDNTTAQQLMTFRDVARANPQEYFTRNNVTYARGFGLIGISDVYFIWADPNGTIRRTSQIIPVDATYQADDLYTHNASSVIGKWMLILMEDGGSEITRWPFYITGPVECGEVLVYPDVNATLESDISGNGTCITVQADNVSLDCSGYTVTGYGIGSGIYIEDYYLRTVKNCIIQNFSSGIYALNSSNNQFYNDTFLLNTYGIYLENSSYNNIRNNTFYRNIYGYLLTGSMGDNMTNMHFYNNTRDLQVNATAYSFELNASDLIFDRISDNYRDYTNLSFDDYVTAASSYYIRWAGIPFPPINHTEFRNKYIEISNTSGNVSIDSIVWYWTNAEASGFNESNIELWKHNASGWGILGNTPNTTTNTYNYYNLVPPGGYGLLVYDTTDYPPRVVIYYPANNSGINYNISIPLNYTAVDTSLNLDSCWYSLDGSGNISLPGCQNTSMNLSEGPHNVTVYANDTNGGVNYSTHFFYVDLTPPLVTIQNPVQGGNYSTPEVPLAYTAGDGGSGLNKSACEYTVDGATTAIGSCNNITMIITSGGIHYVNVTVYDKAGNWNTTETRMFNVSIPSGDAMMVYRSNSGTYGLNSPKMRFWDSSGKGSWGDETELPSAGSPIRYAIVKWSPVSAKRVIITQSDDGYLDAYVCREDCLLTSNWVHTPNIGRVWTTAPATSSRRFDLEFETNTGELVVVYGVVNTAPNRDLAYKVLPASSSSFSAVPEQYIDDSGHTTDVQYTWIRMDRNPDQNGYIIMSGFDSLNEDINAWVWSGSAWGNEVSITDASTATSGYEALAVRYATDGSKGMVMGGDRSIPRNIAYRYWDGSSWSAQSTVRPGSGNTQWLTLKADPATDDMQAVVVTSTLRLYTIYWDGTSMTLSSALDNAVDTNTRRCADFAWNGSTSTGVIVWDTDGVGTTLSQRPCSPQCTGSTTTISTYAGSGEWITMYANPMYSQEIRVLSARLNSNNDIGSFWYNGTAYGNYGDSEITSDTSVTGYEAYSIAFNIANITYPGIEFIPPTQPNGTIDDVNYTYINTSITDPKGISVVYLEWNGVNETLNGIGTNWYKNKTDLASGTYTYRVWAKNNAGNWNVSETRVWTYSTPPWVVVVTPLGETYDQHSYVSIAANITDPNGIDLSYALVILPNGSVENHTLYHPPAGDNFDFNTLGIGWFVEDTTGPYQTCTANINGTIPGKAFTSISGDGSPLTDTLCSLISHSAVDGGNFDINVSFEVLASQGVDNAINFQVMEGPSSAEASKLAFISLSNWTGLGRNYEVYVNDGNHSGYISTRPTNDTYGKFRIKRVGNNFTFYTWNNTGGSWIEENSSVLDINKALFIAVESESAYANWGDMNASWDNLSIIHNNYSFTVFNNTDQLGLYNVSFYARDTLGAVNDSEKTNFTIVASNDPPSTPYILAPTVGSRIYNAYNITWSNVYDEENNSVWFNITLLNPDGSDNITLASNYGNLSTTQFTWNTSQHANGFYSLRIVVFENETAERLNNSYTLPGIFEINNSVNEPPWVMVLSPLGETYSDIKPVPIAANITDPDGINETYATITYPNGTQENLTIYQCVGGDNFNTNTVGLGWWIENSSVGPLQTCIADINGTVPGKAYTSISGDGSPLTDTLCSLVSKRALYGDFDMNVSFEILASPGVDNAINFQVSEIGSSANASTLAFIALSNWTGLGRNYELFVDDGNISDYIATVPTNDTSGKFRIKRNGSYFSFYIWNNTGSSWIELNSTNLSFSNALYVTIESESAYSEWGWINASWEDLQIEHDDSYFNSFNTRVHPVGDYNVSFYARDNRGAVNNTEKTNFTIVDENNPPSTPFILTPYLDQRIAGLFNITWSDVSDPDGDSVWFNITLLNPDGSDNATITFNYGNISSNYYEWDTTTYPDGEYSMRVDVFENETAEELSNSYTLPGTFWINNNPPWVMVLSPLGETYSDIKPVPIAANITDPDGINETYATITYPNGTQENLTLYQYPAGDNFNFNTVGIAWWVENSSVGPLQTCIADINGTVPGKAYTSISGDGSPLTDTLCSLVSIHPVYADFDMNVSFEVLASPGVDNAINFQVSEIGSSANASTLAFIALSNWTGLGRNYELFVDDGNISDYIATVPTNDTSGKFRIKRNGSYFSFYIWNNTGSSWIELNSTNLSFNSVLYITMESESAYPEWGWINASWEDLQIEHDDSYLNVFNTRVHPVGDYNVSFYARDNLGGINDSERSNFTIIDENNPPSTPFILTPYLDQTISGLFNITWSDVSDPDGDSVWFNITLLNPDGSDNATITFNYGNISSNYYEWDTTVYADGEYSMRVDVFENETAEELSNSYTLPGTFWINNEPPIVMVLSPLGETYGDGRMVPISINATDPDGIDISIATVTMPNSTMQNVTLGYGQGSDNFDTDTVDINWTKEEIWTGPSQICIADIDTSIADKAYTSLSGDGSPDSDTLCSLISMKAIDGDFDISIDFNIEGYIGTDNALNFQVMDGPSSANASRLIFMALSNWTGLGKNYEIFADDGNFSDYILTRETNDTYGKFRIKRDGDNFTFYTWNNTNSSWNEEAVSRNEFNITRTLFVAFESESAYPDWGSMNVSWDNFSVQDDGNLFGFFNDTYALGLYNVSFYVTDSMGAANDTEKTNFTIIEVNDPPSKPYLLTPFPGELVNALYNITWSQVTDPCGDSVWFNITLLNPDFTYNATIITNYGDINTTQYEWNTLAYPDGIYSMEIVVFENETAERLSNTYTMTGNFTLDHSAPGIQFYPPTETSGSTINRNYILVNVSAEDPYLNVVEIFLYNSTFDIINVTYSSTSPVLLNFTGLPDGLYYFNASALDTLGHRNSTELRNVTIETIGCLGQSTTFLCGDEITESCTLNTDLSSNGTCFNISADDILLDCSNHSLSGNGSGSGFYFDSRNNVTLKNCVIGNYSSSIAVLSSNNSLFQNNTLFNSIYGIYVDPSYNNTVIENKIYNNSVIGLYLYDSHNNTLRNNTVYENNIAGIYLNYSSNNTLTLNNVSNNTGYGISYRHSNYTSIYYNLLDGNSGDTINGIYSDYVNVSYNTLRNGGDDAIFHYVSLRSRIIGNSMSDSVVNGSTWLDAFANDGIDIPNNTDTVVMDNNISTIDVAVRCDYCRNVLIDNTRADDMILGVGSANMENCNITNNILVDANYGVYLIGSVGGIIAHNNTVHSSGYGFYLNPVFNSTFSDNTVYNNTNAGIYLNGSYNNSLVYNNATDNNVFGINYYQSDYTRIIGNTVDRNGYDGISGNESNYVNITDNRLDENGGDGIFHHISTGSRIEYNFVNNSYSDGIDFANNTDGYVLYNNITNPDAIGIRFDDADGAVISNNRINGANTSLLLLDSTNLSTFNGASVAMGGARPHNSIISNNFMYDSSYGFYLIHATNNTIDTNDVFSILVSDGVYLFNGSDNRFYNNLVSDTAGRGIYILDSNLTEIMGDRYYNNSRSLEINGSGVIVNLSGVIFDNPYGGYQNYTNLSMDDFIAGSASYTINWTANPAALPPGYTSFREKWVNITTLSGTISIDSITWHWLNSELPGYNENYFELWKYNSSGWMLLNNTPDTVANTLSLSGMNPTSGYGILQANFSGCQIIDIPGSYQMTGNAFGAPNNATPLYHYACIKISTSDVVFDCNGYNITDNGTASFYTSYGIMTNETVSNVTIRNCPAVSNYTNGIYLYRSDNGVVENSTVYNVSYGFHITRGTNNLIRNCSAFNATNNAFYIYLYAENSTIADSNAYNSLVGFAIGYNSSNHTVENCTSFGNDYGVSIAFDSYGSTFRNITSGYNTFDGFYVDEMHNNTMENNTALGNSRHGFYFYRSDNNSLSNNIAHNNNMNGFYIYDAEDNTLENSIVYNNSYGFHLSTNATNNTLANNTAYNNSQDGFHLDGVDDNNLFNNSAYNNSNDGFDIKAGSDYNVIERNRAYNNSQHGFHFYSDVHNNLTNNTAEHNLGSGFFIQSCSNHTAKNNSARTNDRGFFLDVAVGNVFEDNHASNSNHEGFLIYTGSNYNILSNNTAYNNVEGFTFSSNHDNRINDSSSYNNSQYGFHLSASNFTIMGNNYAYFNSLSGFYISGSYNNTISNSTANNNSDSGFYVDNSPDNDFINISAYNNSADGITGDYSSNLFIDPSNFNNNNANGVNLNNCHDSEFQEINASDNKGHGLHIVNSDRVNITDSVFCYNHQYGIRLQQTEFIKINNSDICNNTEHGVQFDNAQNTTINFSRVYNNSDHGFYLVSSDDSIFGNTNITFNIVGGVRFDANSDLSGMYSDYVCFNGFDINNSGTSNNGSLDSCGSWEAWNESGHPGCTFRCTEIWHYFYGDVNGSLLLAPDDVSIFYNWTWLGQKGKVYAMNGNATIEWVNLTALGRTTAGAPSNNDFAELDTLMGYTGEPDNINITYSTDGSTPKVTENMTLQKKFVPYVPQANSSVFDNNFTTGIAWDASQGAPQFNVTANQDVVFVTEINTSAQYDYEMRIPANLSTYKGTSGVVEFWLELE